METKTANVKSKTQVVGVATFVVCETLAEAVEHHGEVEVLNLVNTQHKTNEMNVIRQAVTGKPSKKVIEEKAMQKITGEEFTAVAGDIGKLKALMAEKVVEVEKEYEAGREEAIAAAASEVAAAEGNDDELDDDDED